MKAWLLDTFSGIGSIHLAEVPDPIVGEGEVLVEMRYAALNPADRYLAEKQYPAKPPLPHILGRDGVGIVRRIGHGVKGIQVGQECIILRSEIGVNRAGTFAQLVAVPVESLAAVPGQWTATQAAGAALVYLTAYQALTQWGELPEGVILITGASGGVGVASIQLARAMGHTVVALSRSRAKRDELQKLGAQFTYDPADPQWPDELKKTISPRRVDLAIDNIGGDLLPMVINTLGDHGRVSLVGRLAGPVPQFNTATLFFRRLRLGGVAVGAYTATETTAAWREVVALLAKSGAKPVVDRVFDFEQLPNAFDRLAQGPLGKVLLKIRD
ncbi:MAG: zinc-binding alcohol dehydrogenase family protein [Phycisphaerales bacterium]|jgi:NADPH2:quinone reductase|nr:zinc-binding alcohol dehydrogenase family protein [Phycisphaerales bacterium]